MEMIGAGNRFGPPDPPERTRPSNGVDHPYILCMVWSCLVRTEDNDMDTQDIVRKLWNEAGNGNIAVWEDGTMTVVPSDYSGETDAKKPLVVLKSLQLVLKYDFLDFALNDEELLSTIEERIRADGGTVTRGPKT
jgi:hypothetical protein